jgi:hypothetical protein
MQTKSLPRAVHSCALNAKHTAHSTQHTAHLRWHQRLKPKLIVSLIMLSQCLTVSLKAQVWDGTTIPTTTQDDVKLGGYTGTAAKLGIKAGYTNNCLSSGSTITDARPGLSIVWKVNSTGNCSLYPYPNAIKPNIINVYEQGAFQGQFYPIFKINGDKRISYLGDPKSDFESSLHGSQFIAGHLQVNEGIRITNQTLTNANFYYSGYPFSFSVDQGKARFQDEVEINALAYLNQSAIVTGDLTIRGSNTSTPGTNEVKIYNNGYIRARELKIDMQNIPDYVFDKNYQLPTLKEVENYIVANHHLPKIKSAAEYQAAHGVNIGELNVQLLEKVEELTLYLIQQQKEIELLKQQINKN